MNNSLKADTSKPDIPDQILAKWQKSVDLMSEIVGVPSGLIMKIHPQEIEVFVSSTSEGNPYEKGEKARLNTGLYCETVMAQRNQLLIPDARKDPEWDHNPDIELGMISYLGLPLIWPDGETFGTICVLDNKENSYSLVYQKLLTYFREIVEMDLQMIMESAERLKWTEEEVRESEEKFKNISDSAQDAILIMDNQGNISYWNNAAEKIFGYAAQEALGRKLHTVLIPQRYQAAYRKGFGKFRTTGQGPAIGKTLEFEATRKDGTEIPIELSISATKLKGEWNAIGIIRDITERKRVEEELVLSEAFYRDVIENAAGVPYRLIFGPTIGSGHYEFVGAEIENLLGIPPSEFTEKYFFKLLEDVKPISPEIPADLKANRKAFIRGDIPQYRVDLHIRTKDGEQKWLSDSSLPLKDNKTGKIIGGLGILQDITERKRAEEDLQQSYKKLQKAISGNIQLMATAVEIRDPYTAGHQRRVADLARAIATEMALSKGQLEGIYMAGVIHDLGKISVPSEILSKPGKLTEMEFNLIKTHPQVGFDILKEIEFPWPIAQIVYQHHERMDGLGYPQRLSGEKILLEARIMCVADVVEAMASHRPYRPALGIDVALEELKKNRGTFYDKEVVDACVTVFSKKEFKFT